MLKIIFCADGHHVSDFHVLDYVDSVFYEYDFAGRKDMEVKVSNELILHVFTLRLLEKKFPENEIEVYVDNVKLNFDEKEGLCVPDETPNMKVGTHEDIIDACLSICYKNIQNAKRK